MCRANLDNERRSAYPHRPAGRRIQPNEAPDTDVTAARPLRKILSLGFGLAFAFGTTVVCVPGLTPELTVAD
jgi:hypothetical protein